MKFQMLNRSDSPILKEKIGYSCKDYIEYNKADKDWPEYQLKEFRLDACFVITAHP